MFVSLMSIPATSGNVSRSFPWTQYGFPGSGTWAAQPTSSTFGPRTHPTIVSARYMKVSEAVLPKQARDGGELPRPRPHERALQARGKAVRKARRGHVDRRGERKADERKIVVPLLEEPAEPVPEAIALKLEPRLE